MAYCFMRIEKIKTEPGFSNRYAHNFRTMHVPNADPAKSVYNEELISLPKGENYYSLLQKKLRNAPGYENVKPRKDAVKGFEILMTYNSSEVGPDFEFDKWKEENVKWLEETFDKDNVASAVLHMDEAGSPHIHAIVYPFVDGRLNAKKYTGGRKAMADLQTSYAKSMKKVGLERGLHFSKAEHTDISRYYAALNQVLATELPAPEEGENAHEYRDRANKIFVDTNLKNLGEVNKLKRKITEARTMDINDKIELGRLRKRAMTSDKEEKQARRFEEILNGLKNGYFETPEENEAFKRKMQEISKWERERENKAKEKER